MAENKSVPTMKDVAREVGVALGTVSKAVNGIPVGREYRTLFYAADSDSKLVQELVSLAEQQKVDGIIVLSYNPKLQVSPDVPLVSVDRYFGAQFPCVCRDCYGGGRPAAEKLVENGCRRKEKHGCDPGAGF